MRLAQLDLDLRPGGAEAAHHLGQDLGADALERADVERPGLARGECGQVGLRRLEAGHDRLGMAEQDPAGLGQLDGARPAWALDEALADDPFERRDLLADGGLGVAELFGRAAEAALGRNRLQGGQMPQFDSEPSIRFHDQDQ